MCLCISRRGTAAERVGEHCAHGGDLVHEPLVQPGQHARDDVLYESLHGGCSRTGQSLGERRRRYPRFAGERLGQRR